MGICHKDTKEKGNRPSATKHIHVVTKNVKKGNQTGFEPRTLRSKQTNNVY